MYKNPPPPPMKKNAGQLHMFNGVAHTFLDNGYLCFSWHHLHVGRASYIVDPLKTVAQSLCNDGLPSQKSAQRCTDDGRMHTTFEIYVFIKRSASRARLWRRTVSVRGKRINADSYAHSRKRLRHVVKYLVCRWRYSD